MSVKIKKYAPQGHFLPAVRAQYDIFSDHFSKNLLKLHSSECPIGRIYAINRRIWCARFGSCRGIYKSKYLCYNVFVERAVTPPPNGQRLFKYRKTAKTIARMRIVISITFTTPRSQNLTRDTNSSPTCCLYNRVRLHGIVTQSSVFF